MTPDKERRSAYDAALGLLARREHGRFELGAKLGARDYTSDEIDAALERLVELGYQCDQRFAESYVRDRIQRGFGAFRIRGELKDRGVAATVIDTALRPYDDSWRELLEQAYQRRFREASIGDRREWLKRARFLEGRGFETSQIRRLLDSHKAR